MKQKTFITLFFFLGIALGMSSWQNKNETNDYSNLYFQKLNELEASLRSLKNQIQLASLADATERDKIKEQISRCRIKLKGIDIWLRYLEPVSYKKLNGPLPVEWETEVFEKFERPYKRDGAGLSLAWQYLEEREIKKDSLLRYINTASEAFIVYKSDTVVEPLFSYHHFFLCNRLYILNLSAIYTTGFECPDPMEVIPELKRMMKDTKQVYALYNTAYTTYPIPDDYLLLYEKACQFANGQPANLNQFDSFTFIKDYINPLFALNQKLIQDYRVRSKSYVDYTLNDHCVSIFEKSLYKGQQSKGVYFPVENENILDEIRKTGKLLFYDPILSHNNMRSCASCHKPSEYFTDTLVKTNLNFNRIDPLPRNSPSLINAIYNHLLMLDGKHFSLSNQFKAVTSNPDELASNEKEILEKVLSCKTYKSAFKKFLPLTKTEKEITFDQIISAVTLYYSDFSKYLSPFDEIMNGNITGSAEIKNGFNLFMGKAQCGTCHFVPQFNGVKPPFISTEFEVLGVPEDTTFKTLSKDKGRYVVNPAPEMLNAFRTGSLRNSAHTKPYAHNGVFNSLTEIIDFYDAGGGSGKGIRVENQTLSGDSLHLTPAEKKSLLVFLESLTEKINFEPAPEKLPVSTNKSLNLRLSGGVY